MSEWYPLLALTLTVFTLLVFVRAAVHKILDFGEFEGFVADYQLVPDTAVRPVSTVLLGLEILIVSFLLINPLRDGALMLAAGLLMLYGTAIAINLKRGRTHIECGCGGAPRHLSGTLLWRNLTLTILALLPLFASRHALTLAESTVSIAAGMSLWLLYALFEQANANLMALTAKRNL
jgi:hypothetical protein